MNILKYGMMSVIMISLSTITFAESNPTIKFFASNNVSELNEKTAFNRLVGKAQHDLNNSLIEVLQKNHIEQGSIEDILGEYQMESDKNMTNDNTEIFYASPWQQFSSNQIFSLAAQLANTLKQESVAVFIPSKQAETGDVIVTFKSDKPGIVELVSKIREELPAHYAIAFSLHLIRKCQGFENSKVSAIEWLGRNINIDEIRHAFPDEIISFVKGQVYLVNKNGQAEQL